MRLWYIVIRLITVVTTFQAEKISKDTESTRRCNLSETVRLRFIFSRENTLNDIPVRIGLFIKHSVALKSRLIPPKE